MIETKNRGDTCISCLCLTDMRKKKLLILEDNKDMQIIYDDMLKADYRLYPAESAVEAIKILEKTEIDLMIIDAWLGNENARDFFTWLRDNDRLNRLRVICVAVDKDLKPGLRRFDPCLEFIIKPFTKRQLVRAIEKKRRLE